MQRKKLFRRGRHCGNVREDFGQDKPKENKIMVDLKLEVLF